MSNAILESVTNHPFTQGLLPEHCETLASLGRETSFGRDEIIFREGDPKHEFFLLLMTISDCYSTMLEAMHSKKRISNIYSEYRFS